MSEVTFVPERIKYKLGMQHNKAPGYTSVSDRPTLPIVNGYVLPLGQ